MNPEHKEFIDKKIENVFEIENKIVGLQGEHGINLKKQITLNNKEIKGLEYSRKEKKLLLKKKSEELKELVDEYNGCMDENRTNMLKDIENLRIEKEKLEEEYKRFKLDSAQRTKELFNENMRIKDITSGIDSMDNLMKLRRKELNEIVQYCYNWMNSEVD